MPYIPHTDADRASMLETIGVESIDDLFVEIPEHLKLKGELDIPSALDEYALTKYMRKLAAKNKNLADHLICFAGAGIYDRFIPQSVGAIISRGEFLTAYTPYQPEFSQGYLQTIYEFQTMIADIYNMDVANASMYDGATSVAEAALIACAIKDKDRVAYSEGLHPHYRQVLETYCWSSGVELVRVPLNEGRTFDYSSLDDSISCILVQTPNFFGVIEDMAAMREACDRTGAMMIVNADPVAMALINPPGAFGADFVTGEAQPVGIPMGLGGPVCGLFASKSEFVRRIPGRIVGKTVDHEGTEGFVMTLRTREQDIRREKATSNICTNEALMALAATVYLSAMGKNGLKSVAESSVRNAQYALARLEEAGAKRKFASPFFCEFVVELPVDADLAHEKLAERGFLAGVPLGKYFPNMHNCLLLAFTELRTREEIDQFANAVAEVARS